MAAFTISYRLPSGGLKSEVIDAADRASALAQMKARGITPVSVKEGGTLASAASSSAVKSAAWIKGAAAGVVVVVAAIVAWVLLMPMEKATPAVEQKKKARVAKPERTNVISRVSAPVTVRPVTQTSTNAVQVVEKTPGDDLPPHKRIVEIISVVTNADGSLLERFRTADGKTRSRQSAPPAVFNNASDQLIAMAITGAESGHAMPPMPMTDSAVTDFAESLKKDIVVNDDDPENVKELKKLVMETRQEILKRMGEGMTYAEVMREHCKQVNDNVAFRGEALAQAQKLVDEGAKDLAAAYVERANELLRASGINEIEMPLTKEERRAAIRERAANK